MKDITVDGLTFRCATDIEAYRAKTLLTKEPGTIRWLAETLTEGGVFWDVGANVGCYTLYAARIVGAGGHVYAFEPHVGNAAALLRNIAVNGLGARISVLTCALHEQAGGFVSYLPFNYPRLVGGASGGQLDHCRDEHGHLFEPKVVELKATATIHGLVTNGICRTPDWLKVDVDGNEVQVLNGMLGTMTGLAIGQLPRAIQVEIHQATAGPIEQLVTAAGYSAGRRHDTASGQAAIAKGADPETVPHNRVYERAA